MPKRVTMARAMRVAMLDVGLRAGGDLVVAEDQFLGDAAAEGDAEIGMQLLARSATAGRVPAGA